MEAIFTPPFTTRNYPSPRTGEETTVHVKEMLLTSFPVEFVEQQFDIAWKRGHHLMATDIHGTRAWTSPEIKRCTEEFGNLPREHPWMEVWEILTKDQVAVLDLVMFTDFYTDKAMDRFEEFARLALPLIEDYGAVIKRACAGGVLLHASRIGDDEWQTIADKVLAFNEKHFTVERPRSAVLKSWRGSRTLCYGHC